MSEFTRKAVLALAPLFGASLLGCSSDSGTQADSTATSATSSVAAGVTSTTASSSSNAASGTTTSVASVTSATTGGTSSSTVASTTGTSSTGGTGGSGGTGTSATTSSSGAGGAGGGGSGGVGGASATTGPLTPADVVGNLDGYLYRGECDGGSASFECPLSGCTGNVFNEQAMFTAAGEAGTIYDVTVHVYGVVELRSDYEGGERRQGASTNANSNKDFWYAGGAYTPGAGYNVYGLRVTPAVEGVENVDADGNNYFLNARDSSGEGHEVWELNYEATFPVAAGGSVEFSAYDPNCLQIMNNSETARPSGDGPNGSIVVDDVASADPPPADFEQPLSTGGRTGQWVFIDVVEVTARAD